MWSPIILIESLFAPTVPSEPSPQNLQEVVPLGVVSGASVTGSERLVTSSVIDRVNSFLGSGEFIFAYTAIMCAGSVSFEPRP